MDTIRKNQTKTKNESLCLIIEFNHVYLSDIFFISYSDNEYQDLKCVLSFVFLPLLCSEISPSNMLPYIVFFHVVFEIRIKLFFFSLS